MSYVNDASVTAVGILFAVLTVIAVLGRFESRRRWKTQIGADDLLIIPAGILVVASAIIMIVGAQNDIIGGHSPTQNGEAFLGSELERQVLLEKYEYALLLLQPLAIGTIKLSILFFYRRIFRGHPETTPFDFANWTLIGISLALMIAAFFSILFGCGTHFEALWGSIAELKMYCVDTFWQHTVLAIINFVMDLAVLVEPLIMVWRLNMKRFKKFQASCVFLVAALAVAAACVKMVSWIKITIYDLGSGKPLLGLPNGNDDIGVVSILLFWNFMEIGVGMIVACLPSHRRYLEIVYNHGVQIWQASSIRSLITRSSGSQVRQRPQDAESGESIHLDHIAQVVPKDNKAIETSFA